MDPISPILLGVMVGSSVAGTVLSAGSQIMAGQERAAAAKQQERMYLAEAAAKEEKGVYEEEQHREKIRRIVGTQRALYAKAGVDITEGSPLLTMITTELEGEKEAKMIRKGYEVEAGQSYGEAKLASMYGRSAARAGMIGGVSTFLTGLGQAGTQYYGLKKGIS